MPRWSQERVEALRHLLAVGVPFTAIASQLGTTKGAVSGAVHRAIHGHKDTRRGRVKRRPPRAPHYCADCRCDLSAYHHSRQRCNDCRVVHEKMLRGDRDDAPRCREANNRHSRTYRMRHLHISRVRTRARHARAQAAVRSLIRKLELQPVPAYDVLDHSVPVDTYRTPDDPFAAVAIRNGLRAARARRVLLAAPPGGRLPGFIHAAAAERGYFIVNVALARHPAVWALVQTPTRSLARAQAN